MSGSGQVAPSMLVKARPGFGPRLVCLGTLLLLALVIVGIGERTTSLQGLENAVASGSVSSVQVTDGLSPGDIGFTVQRVTWRQGLVHHRTEIVQASRGESVQGVVQLPVLYEPVTTRLQQLQPGLVIERDTRPSELGEVLGWHVPTWTAVLALVGALGVLALLVTGPTPWRASRWAWFWLFTSPVGLVAAVAFLLLSGPTPGIPEPGSRARRLTGRWAFLGATVLVGLTSGLT